MVKGVAPVSKVTDIEAIIKWATAVPEDRDDDCPLSEEQQKMFLRLNTADDLYKMYGEKKAYAFLMEKYGYSEKTARRDVAAAMRLFGYVPAHKKAYLTRNFIDELQDARRQALKAQKFGDYARIAGVSRDVLRDMSESSPLQDAAPTMIIPMADPALLEGLERIDDDKLAAFKERMARAKHGDGFIQDAQIVSDDE
jgi:hypothetical protein